MDLGECIKKVRAAKGVSQKQVALACKMDTSNYSRIESSKTDPVFSSVVKIAKALGIELTDLFRSDEVLKDINSLDKSLMEKITLIEQLDKKEKQGFYSVLDAFVGKKKLRDALGSVLQNVE